MNRVRERDNARSFLDDHMITRDHEQMPLPVKSPTLKTRKWTALNRRGWVAGFVGRTEMVIGGNTD